MLRHECRKPSRASVLLKPAGRLQQTWQPIGTPGVAGAKGQSFLPGVQVLQVQIHPTPAGQRSPCLRAHTTSRALSWPEGGHSFPHSSLSSVFGPAPHAATPSKTDRISVEESRMASPTRICGSSLHLGEASVAGPLGPDSPFVAGVL